MIFTEEGRIKEYKFQISDDGKNWQTVVSGHWDRTAEAKTIRLLDVVEARYIRLEATRAFGRENFATAAEISILQN